MGYESKLIVGEAFDLNHEAGVWVDVIATYDLGKMGYANEWAQMLTSSRTGRMDTRRFFFYAGDEKITEDLYGDALLPLDIVETVKVIEALGYPHVAPCRSLLRSFYEHPDEWPDLVVLHFGH